MVSNCELVVVTYSLPVCACDVIHVSLGMSHCGVRCISACSLIMISVVNCCQDVSLRMSHCSVGCISAFSLGSWSVSSTWSRCVHSTQFSLSE